MDLVGFFNFLASILLYVHVVLAGNYKFNHFVKSNMIDICRLNLQVFTPVSWVKTFYIILTDISLTFFQNLPLLFLSGAFNAAMFCG